MFRWLCSIAYVTKAVCYIVKPLDYICKLIDFMGDLGTKVVRIIKLRLTEFGNHMKTIFYVSVKYEHTFKFDTNQSRAPNEVTAGIVTEIRKRTDKFIMLFDWMSFVFSFFFFLILAKVYYYRQKFLTSDRYDNHYITPYFRDLDIRRARMDQETVLPLHRREARKYITITSIKLVYNERLKLTKSAIFLGAWTLKMMIHMVMDYSLYWVLAKIHYHGRFQSQIEAPNLITLRVEGEGAVADIYKSTVKAFTPFAGIHALDAVPCLPIPIAPNMSRYYQIVSLLILCWIMVIVEPYGLRMRHVVMSYYHPTRAIQRTVWLYNNVLRARGNFLKYARRQLRRKVKGNEGIEKITCLDRLRASCPLLNSVLGATGQESCLMCATVVRPGDAEQLIHCQHAGCVGRYCVACYMDLQNICTVCLEPVEYGDPSDMDEEKDSSDENPEAYKPKKRRHIRKKKPKKRKEEDSSDGDDKDGGDNDDSSRRDDDDGDDETELMSSGTDVSTDLSYSYQDRDFEDRKDDSSGTRFEPKCVCVFRDVERQYRLQLATVQDFNFMDGYQGADYHRPTSADRASSDVYIPLHGSDEDEMAQRKRITWDPITLDNEGVRPRRKRKPRRRRRGNPRMCHENFNPIRLISRCLMKVFSVRRNCDKPPTEYRQLVAGGDPSTSDDSSGSCRATEPHFTQSEQLIGEGRTTATRQASAPQLRTATQDDRALYCRTKSPRYGRRDIPSDSVEAFAWSERDASGGERVQLRELNPGYPSKKRREDGEVRLQSAFTNSQLEKAVGRTPAGIHIPLRVASVGGNLNASANEKRAKQQKRKRLHNTKLNSSRNSSPTKSNYQSHSMHNTPESQARGTRRENPHVQSFDVPGASQRQNVNSPHGGNLNRDQCCPPRTDSETLMHNYAASSSDWPGGGPGTGLDGGTTTDLSQCSSSPRGATTDRHVERAPMWPRHDTDSWEYFDERRPRGSESYDSPRSATESPPTYDTSPDVSPRVMQVSTLYEGERMRKTMQQLGVRREDAVHKINEATRVHNTENSRTQPIASLPGSLPRSRREYINKKYTDAHKKLNEERMPESPTRSKPAKKNVLKYVLTGKSYSSDTESD